MRILQHVLPVLWAGTVFQLVGGCLQGHSQSGQYAFDVLGLIDKQHSSCNIVVDMDSEDPRCGAKIRGFEMSPN